MNTFLRSCSQIRRFCAEAARVHFKPRRKGKKNIAEVGSYLPNGGVGMKFTRVMWIRNGYKDSYWTITKILEKNKGRLRYYGRLTWKGKEDPRERPVRTGQKRGWRYVLEGDQKTLNGKTAKDCRPLPPLVRAEQRVEG